ncbi:MAG: lysophospholipid acyltransferase family protein [Puniceicoccales bacterium]|nr:lysophospholipid acyltransferase family protein [Puniceicoccales bacterium]
MVSRALLTAFGWLVAHLPTWLLHPICQVFGRLFLAVFRGRRLAMKHNIAIALPELRRRERRAIAKTSATRLVELGLFALAAPFLSRSRIRKTFSLAGPWADVLHNLRSGTRPQLLLIPHQTLTEALTFLPFLLACEEENLPIAILYRPFANAALENFVRRTRERFGLQLFARKHGPMAAVRIIRRGGCVGLLFDQNAGPAGTLSLLCGHISSTTPLPNLLREAGAATVWMASVERTGFFSGILSVEALPDGPVTATMNLWLENRLKMDGRFCRDWLWAHRRWKCPTRLALTLAGRRNDLAHALKIRGLAKLPKSWPTIVHLPAATSGLWANVQALVLALQTNRPDAFIKILCHPRLHAAAILAFPTADGLVKKFSRGEHWELFFTFSKNPLAGLAAAWHGIPLRIGLHGRGRQPFLTHLPDLASLGLPTPVTSHGRRDSFPKCHKFPP